MESQAMCPVCTLYLRPGMTLHDHLYTHPKDQVIEALVRLAAGHGTMLSPPSATINTNSQFTAITYRQFQTLTTSVPEPNIPMMINPCLVSNPPTNTPFTSGVIRSSVPLISYPYYQPEQSTNLADHERVASNTHCSYSLATQTTQTTQTNSPLVTPSSPFQEAIQNTSPFQEANCESAQDVDDASQGFEPADDPFMDDRVEEPQREIFVSNKLPEIISEPREEQQNCLIINNKIVGIHKASENSVIENIHERTDIPFQNERSDNINVAEIDPFVDDRIEEVREEKEPDTVETTHLADPDEDNLIDTSPSLGTVISNTHRLIANDPGLDYDEDIRTHSYNENSYENFSPTRNIVSPVSDVSNWSTASTGLRVRRDLSNYDEHGNLSVSYVQPNSNAAELVTSDPFDDRAGNQPSEAQLTNLDDVNYSMALNYSTNQQLPRISQGDVENKEDNSEHSTPLNIHSDELMPPRGELSGQESLGATENSVWELPDNGEPSTPSYPRLDKDRWQILGSAIQEEINESYSNVVESRTHSVKCLECDMMFTCIRERRIHVQTIHYTPRHTQVKTEESTSRLTRSELQSQIIKIKQERGIPVKTEASVRTCNDCGLELTTVKEYRKHRRESHDVRRKCGTCETVFADNLTYKEHIAKVHPIECTICGKFFSTKTAANSHSKHHLKCKPYQCTVCDKSFLSRMKLKEHNNTHSGEAPLKCTMCDQAFRRHSNLIQHKNHYHLKMKKKIKDYFCHCGEIFHSIKKLQWHKEIHDTKPKQCMYCSERYVHSTSLTRHIRHTHDSTYLPKVARAMNVLCPICKITCVRSSLAQHMKIHSGDKSFSCNVCSKEFSTNWNLQMHKWTHASRNSKPYKCKQCKCAFYMLNSYQAHVRSHRNIRPYTCNYCGRQFIRKYNCIRHVKEHEVNKSYCCAVCNKTFHRSYYLSEHMRTHTGVKPYTCHICSKTSSTKSNHNKHVRTHHAREPVNTEG